MPSCQAFLTVGPMVSYTTFSAYLKQGMIFSIAPPWRISKSSSKRGMSSFKRCTCHSSRRASCLLSKILPCLTWRLIPGSWNLNTTPFILRIQSVSSRRPLTTSEWLPYTDHSHPEIRCTFEGNQSDYQRHQNAIEKHRRAGPKDFKAVSHKLPKFLENEGKEAADDIVATPQNDVFAGVTAWFLMALMFLCKELGLKQPSTPTREFASWS